LDRRALPHGCAGRPCTHAARGRPARTSGRAATTAREASRSALLRVLTPQVRSRDWETLTAPASAQVGGFDVRRRGRARAATEARPPRWFPLTKSASAGRAHMGAFESHLMHARVSPTYSQGHPLSAAQSQRSASRSPTCFAQSHLHREHFLAQSHLRCALPLALRRPSASAVRRPSALSDLLAHEIVRCAILGVSPPCGLVGPSGAERAGARPAIWGAPCKRERIWSLLASGSACACEIGSDKVGSDGADGLRRWEPPPELRDSARARVCVRLAWLWRPAPRRVVCLCVCVCVCFLA
jgi:hypothetical protein